MFHAIFFLYLFLPHKRRLIPLQLAFFYVWAGLLKLDSDWLTGGSFYRKENLPLPDVMFIPSLYYVVVLELGIVWGLLVRHKYVFWGSFAQFVLFHIVSFGIVDFFYPFVMFALLSIFVTDRLFPMKDPLGYSFVRGREAKLTYAYIIFFCALQLPRHFMPGNPTVSGEGRLLTLHMFDAQLVCESKFRITRTDGSIVEQPVLGTAIHTRIKCDPILVWNLARDRCRRSSELEMSKLHVELRSRLRDGDDQFHTVIDMDDFCAKDPSYSIWRHNNWIFPHGY
jgi:hypothetical protein